MIPGFGIAGVAGITLTIGALVLIMINNDAFDFEFVRMNDILIAMAATVGGLLGGFSLLFIGGARFTNSNGSVAGNNRERSVKTIFIRKIFWMDGSIFL